VILTAEALERYQLRARFPEVIDSSMLSDFASCPSKFYLRHVLGLRRKGHEDMDALDWGTKWHKVQHLWWRYIFEGASPSDAATQAIIEATMDWPASLSSDKHGRTKERLAMIFADYIQKFSEEDMRSEVLRTEQFFDVFDEELGLRWCGRIDQIRRIRGKIRVWDFKTSSAMGPSYFDQYENSFQFPGYVLIASKILTEPIDGITMDVAYTLKSKHEFFRRSFRYSDARLHEWLENVKLYL
jgi:hypothetical protein